MKQKCIPFRSLAACLLIAAAGTQLQAQTTTITGPTGSGQFGKSVTVLSNGNYVVADPFWDNGGTADVGAVYLYNGSSHALISTLTGSIASDQVGSGGITALTNGNFAVVSTSWDNGAVANAGAVTWGNGTTGITGTVSSSNSLVGGHTSDIIGNPGVTALSNGNYLVRSAYWDNATTFDVGAVTLGNGSSGTTGLVSSSNSLVGSHGFDLMNTVIISLSNGNYVVHAPEWDNGSTEDAGAVTWGSASSGVTGVISSSNSLIGITDYEYVGSPSVTALSNGNYVVNTTAWDDGFSYDVGAVTWCNGTTGRTGNITSGNSLVGSADYDYIGSSGVTALSNGNYVVSSEYWHNGGLNSDIGAVTWGNGASGTTGVVSSSNSLVGSNDYDAIGNAGVTALTNGNYVVRSNNWSNGLFSSVGAVTWGNGTTGITGAITSSNSLVGSSTNDYVGCAGVTALSNGNYVVNSRYWNDGATSDVGAITWGNGTTGISGTISSSNSLVGSTTGDNLGNNGVVALTNGNYVVATTTWSNGASGTAGAVTWGNGTTGTAGVVSSSNSLVGTNSSALVGYNGVKALSNGNYVIGSSRWDNGATTDVGAVTWANGSTGITGTINSSNSLIGSSAGDEVGGSYVIALANGNYIVQSANWDNGATANVGAITWGNGTSGTSGLISNSNSLIGNTANDQVGNYNTTIFTNGAYVVKSSTYDGAALNSGSASFNLGATYTKGVVGSCNSVLGSISNSINNAATAFSSTGQYLLAGIPLENKLVIFNPTDPGLASATTTSTQPIAGTGKAPFVDNSCQLINALQQSGASPVSGSVANQVYVESSAPTDAGKAYTRRHYEITPATNPATSTATVTLYFTQADFNDYNSNNGTDPDLPTGSADASGIANLRISHQHGTSGTGAPGSYSGATQTIDPADASIVWNNTLSRWEVTFDITGFSGFFAFGDNTALPLHLLSFSARLINTSDVELRWNVTNQSGNETYTVERSNDGNNFGSIGNVTADNRTEYTLHDLQPMAGKSYYRLKTIGADGTTSYSEVRSIFIGGKSEDVVNVYPSPAKNYFIIESSAPNSTGTLSDMQGRTLMNVYVNSGERIDISSLAPGIYVLKLSNGYSTKLVKE